MTTSSPHYTNDAIAARSQKNGEAAAARARSLAIALRKTSANRDALRILPYEALQQLRDHELLTLRTPDAQGTGEVDYGDVARVIAELARGDSNVAQLLIPHYVYLERVRLMGTTALKQHISDRVRDGALIGNASTERGSSTSGEITIRLIPEDDGFRLSGTKFYSTPTLFADLVFATVLDPQDRIVYAVIPTGRDGITRLDDWDDVGQRLTGSGTTIFDNVRVESNELVIVGDWMTRRHYTSSGAQILFAAVKSGIARAALDEAIDWAREGARPTRTSRVEQVTLDPFVQILVGELSTTALAALHIAQKLFDVGGTSTALRRHNFDRHWRNARTISLHAAIVYRNKAVGAYALRGDPPPLGFTY